MERSKDIPPLAHTNAALLASRKFHLALERVGDVGRKRKVEQFESDAIAKKPCLPQSRFDSLQFHWESFLMPEVPHNAVHHFWVSLEQGKNFFDNPKKSCLASFSELGYAQVIWTWEAIQFGDIDGVQVCSLESLFPRRFGEALLRYGMAVVCLKDLVELAVLYKYGGSLRTLIIWPLLQSCHLRISSRPRAIGPCLRLCVKTWRSLTLQLAIAVR